jgi:hypothetical protein
MTLMLCGACAPHAPAEDARTDRQAPSPTAAEAAPAAKADDASTGRDAPAPAVKVEPYDPMYTGEKRKALPAQQAVLDAFAKHTVSQKAVVDANGNVVRLAISNHGGFWRGEGDPPKPMPEALFKEGIAQLPHLEAIGIEKQLIGDDAYALLTRHTKLRDVRLHYLLRDGGATKDAPLFINHLPLPLAVLEIKHCFSIRGGCMDKLKAQPELRKLEIDTGYAGPEAVGFIVKSPKLVNLQIHRTTMTDPDLQKIFKACGELEILLIRPHQQRRRPDRITGRSLRGLVNCPKLRMIVLGIEWGELPWEDGLEVLSKLPKLRQVDFAINDIKDFSLDHPSVQRLHRARPDLLLRHKGKTLGGKEDQHRIQEDSKWKWDGGVTTHG